MDFSRNAQPQGAAPGHVPTAATNGGKRNDTDKTKWGRIGTVIVGAALTVLIVAVVLLIGLGGKSDTEGKFVDNKKLQAVFLNTGQVYFGKIKTLNSKYFVVTNIYYLQTSNTGGANTAAAANTSVSLVKLGCELHEPFDQMVINRDQVTFWENLQDNGQVAKAVKTFQTQNPTGQKCADQSNASGSTTNNVQNAGTANPGSPAPAATNPTRP